MRSATETPPPASSDEPRDELSTTDEAISAAAKMERGALRTPSRIAVVVLVVGLVVTAALAWTSSTVYDRNEDRLLDLRVRELGLVLANAVTAIQTPLASAAELANATNGDPDKFRAFMEPYVGQGRQFASASLWPSVSSRLAPTTVVGVQPTLRSLPGQTRAFLTRARKAKLLSVTGILSSPSPRLGYAFHTPGQENGFVVYAENPLPQDRRSRLASRSAFSDLNYVLYLGRSRKTPDLLVTNLEQRQLPVHGRQASSVVPFGDSAFTLVVTPRSSLGGTFFQSLPWIIAGVGALLAVAAALMTDGLARRRRQAEQLVGILDRVAAENREMYAEQRSIAQSLQHAMLPEELPQLRDLQATARYVPSSTGIDVGGDWYDLVQIDDRCAFLMVGDVSGHGLQAANTMAAVRHAALAYAAQDHSPTSVLTKLSDFVSGAVHEYFATLLCGLIDLDARRLRLATAGHLPPLLIEGGEASYVKLSIGPPIGAPREAPYQEASVPLTGDATLIAYTDGLVERRGETLDAGMGRLRRAAIGRRLSLDELVDQLVRELAFDGHDDDTAILGVRWRV